MTNGDKAREIKRLLDEKLDLASISREYDGSVDRGTIELFQQLFVEILNFDRLSDPFGGVGETVSTDDWNERSKAEDAYLIAESGNYRVVYIKLEKLTRTSQRFAIKSLTREGWAQKGEFIAIFHAEDSNIWHLVSPYVEEGKELGDGRTVLRRYVVGEGETHRTVSRNLAKMNASLPSPLFERIEEAFQLKPVTEDFYDDYKETFNLLKNRISEQGADIGEAKTYAHLLLNRLMFLYFIQKKGWLHSNKNFMKWYLDKYKESNEEDNFHSKWLEKLFFFAMNKPPEEKAVSEGFPEEVCEALNSIPFLNGGLFEENEVDQLEPELSDSLMRQVVEGFLENYNFTVTEESPFDKDVAVDPAMLGKIYESLIAEQERGKAGIFYTPRVEVDLMCRIGLYEYLTEDREEEIGEEESSDKIQELISEESREELIEFIFTPETKWDFEKADKFKPIRKLLDKAKIVDPACGSGAFLVGMMQVYAELYRKMGIEPDYHLKEMIVNGSLHGVDIKDWAVRMAEFRLWLSLIESEEELPEEEPVLPNFSFKLHVGDSIVQKIGDEQVSLEKIRGKTQKPQEIMGAINELEKLKEKHFSGKNNFMEEIQQKQTQILDKYLDIKIKRLNKKKRESKQLTLEGELSDEAKEKVEGYERQIEELKEEKKKLHEAREKGKFIWDLDFSEVMLNGGFDIVIANPPYVVFRKIKVHKIDTKNAEVKTFSDGDKLHLRI